MNTKKHNNNHSNTFDERRIIKRMYGGVKRTHTYEHWFQRAVFLWLGKQFRQRKNYEENLENDRFFKFPNSWDEGLLSPMSLEAWIGGGMAKGKYSSR